MKPYLCTAKIAIPVGANSLQEAHDYIRELMELSDKNGQEVSLDKLGLTQLDWTVDEMLDESETPDDWKDTNLYNVEGEDCITVSSLLSPETKHERKVKAVTKVLFGDK